MIFRRDDKPAIGRRRPGGLLWLVVLLGASGPASPVMADLRDAGWHIDTPLYIKGASHYRRIGDAALSSESLRALAELVVASRYRPFSAGLFADYQYVPGSADEVLSLGASFTYRIGRWDAKSLLFRRRPRNAPGNWSYAGRIRYSLTGRQKVGVEASGSFENAGSTKLPLGYYGGLSRSLSLNVAIGRATGGGPDLMARTELTWQLK
jgi:hypothetical protein